MDPKLLKIDGENTENIENCAQSMKIEDVFFG